MIQRDYLIIGTGIGGASACEGLRKHDKRGSATIVGAEIFHPYNRWILSKSFLREKDPQVKKIQLHDAHWYDAHKIETRLGTIVTQFNIDRRLAVLGMAKRSSLKRPAWLWGAGQCDPLSRE